MSQSRRLAAMLAADVGAVFSMDLVLVATMTS
jgi:hypothetical protein